MRLKPEEICHVLTYVWENYEGKQHLPEPLNIPFLAESWKQLTASGSGIAFANFSNSKPAGVLLGLISPDLHTGKLQGIEYLWAGRSCLPLLDAFAEECRARNCHRIIVGLSKAIGPRAPALRRLYKMRGFVLETESFSKSF
jgi:hypothetical protein